MSTIPVIAIVIALIFVVWYTSTSNKLNVLIVKIDESLSGIDVALSKRYDVLTKMIEVVNSYADYERDTLFKTIILRKAMSLTEKSEANLAMDENLNMIRVIAEDYPELKSSENYRMLQLTIADVEEHLQAARRLYNSNVSLYNQMLVAFPSSIVANSKGLEIIEFFQADESKLGDVEIKL